VNVGSTLRKKTAEFFNSMFDYGGGAIAGGFYPVQTGGMARPPINAARANTGRIITPQAALSIAAAWACVWLIADTISTLPFILNRRKGSAFGAPATDLPLYTVLHDAPNDQMSSCEFWQVMIASDMLWGNGYARKTTNVNGDVISLDPMRPEYMVPYRAPPSGVIRYKYYSPLGTQDYSADQIFHLKDRTVDGLVGLSRIEYARNSLGIAWAADEATSDTFRNGLRSGGFVQSEKYLKKEQRDQLSESLQAFATGNVKAGGMMVLEGGLDFKPLTMNPQDVQLLASRQFAVEDVCRWFAVPPVLIGHAAAGVTAWGTGIEQLMLGWLALSLRPYVRRIEQAALRALIAPADRLTQYLTVDTDDLLGADSAARAALYSTLSQNGIMTRNEIRGREDLPPLPGGDVLTVQSNLIPIDQLGKTPPAQTPAGFGEPPKTPKAPP
jgi:HK97 family phage portal protein